MSRMAILGALAAAALALYLARGDLRAILRGEARDAVFPF